MDLVLACVLEAGLFAATTGLFHAAEKRTHAAYLRRVSAARTALRVTSCAALALLLVYAVTLAGVEIAVPVWLGLLGVAGTASLFLAAISQKWHLAAGFCAGLLGIAGVAADTAARLSG